jgi:hypothetical protein
MKSRMAVLALVAVLLGPAAGGQHADEAKHVAVKPDAVKWGPAPPGLPAGAQAAILVGDPTKNGPYVMRAKMPDGYVVPPHWHPVDENVTVLQGALLIGEGEKFDEAKLEELPVGSFMRMPKTMRHFAKAKGETIIQLHGTEPFEITYVNPADDPRKK